MSCEPFESEKEKDRADGTIILASSGLAAICWVISEFSTWSFGFVGGIFAIPALLCVVCFVLLTNPKDSSPRRYYLMGFSGVYLGAYVVLFIAQYFFDKFPLF